MGDDMGFLDATAQAELVRSGEVTPLELVEGAIARVEKLNPQLNAVIHPLFDRARVAAASPDLADGPFRGVPIVVKDLDGALTGAPYHQGTKFLKRHGFVADHDCYLFAKLQDAGFVVIGKTNTPEFGLQPTTEPEAYGPSANPWDLTRTTGGSSGGSAAAVASGMVPVAHAGDGGGSIRIPASICGLVGLKPSRGRVSLGPDQAESWGGAVARGTVNRSVRDAAAVLDVLAGAMPGDPYTAPPPARPFLSEVGADPGRLRIGIRTQAFAGVTTKPECVAACEATGRLLESLGHIVEPGGPSGLDDPALGESFTPCFTVWVANDVAELERLTGEPVGPGDVEPATWLLAEIGRTISGVDFARGIERLHALGRVVSGWWAEGWDLLLTPTIPEPPFKLGSFAGEGGLGRSTEIVPFTIPFNVTGQPAISLPLHWSDGLPIGMQLVAAYGREDLLIRVASQLEAAQPWADRRPPITL